MLAQEVAWKLTWLNMAHLFVFRQSLRPKYLRNLASAQEVIRNHIVLVIFLNVNRTNALKTGPFRAVGPPQLDLKRRLQQFIIQNSQALFFSDTKAQCSL